MDQIVSPAAQVIVSIIPVVGICFAASVIFFALLWKHRENVMLIQRDLYKPPRIDMKSFSLLLGLCLVGVGIVLSVMFILLKPLSWGLLGGLIPFAVGLMLLVYNRISG
ncbi:hypothetical protein [Treponema sp.]|uniref:hypothetical protein n=1 Tax=Treponema sp. TaxID=166 RepID=UPI003F0A6FFF